MKTILIVDDQPIIRKMIRLALRDHFALEEAGDADEAYERLMVKRPAALVLDVMMPGSMNGFQLCQRIKGDSALASVHVVLVTACGQVSDQELGQELGADAYFVKPFSPLALARHLTNALLPAAGPAAT
jgi:DNA-binding response OmpR family regulator